MKTFKNAVVKGYNGEPIKKPEGEDLDILSLFYLLVNSAPCEKMSDSIQGMHLAMALDKAKTEKKDIELEESVWEWLRNVTEKVGPAMFRFNAQPVLNLIKDGYEKGGK